MDFIMNNFNPKNVVIKLEQLDDDERKLIEGRENVKRTSSQQDGGSKFNLLSDQQDAGSKFNLLSDLKLDNIRCCQLTK